MQDKTCSKCLQVKAASEFYKRKGTKDGLHKKCKPCHNAQVAHGRTKEAKARAEAAWRKRNPHRRAEWQAKRRAAKIERSLPLSEEAEFALVEIYHIAQLRSESTGVPHAVDHIVPLQGDNVSGLHVPWNLQVITASENSAKGNTWTT